MHEIPTIPHSVDAEKAVLGSILLNRDAITAVVGYLYPEHFYVEQHAIIFKAMRRCAQQGIPPDLRLVVDELRRHGQLEWVGGVTGLSALVDTVPTSYHIEYYARNVVRAALQRQLITAGATIAQLGYDETGDIASTLARATSTLAEIERASSIDTRYQPQRISDLLAMDIPPVRWIVPDLLPEGLTLLCGKPKLGKSWLSLAVALAVSSGGRAIGHIPVERGPVLYLALEDNQRRLRSRMVKLIGERTLDMDFWYETEWPRLNKGGLSRLNAWLSAHPDTRLVVIDTLGMVRSETMGKGNPYADDYAAMGELKAIADKYKISILAVHHRTKAETEDYLDSVAGSTGLIGAVDGFMVLERKRGEVEAGLFITGRDIEIEQEIALLWDAVTAQWTSAGDAAEYRLSREREEILGTLREAGKPLKPKEIADIIDKPQNAVYQLLKRMCENRTLERNEEGRYWFTTPPASTEATNLHGSGSFHDSMTPMTPMTPAKNAGVMESWSHGADSSAPEANLSMTPHGFSTSHGRVLNSFGRSQGESEHDSSKISTSHGRVLNSQHSVKLGQPALLRPTILENPQAFKYWLYQIRHETKALQNLPAICEGNGWDVEETRSLLQAELARTEE
jgi:hypothetical protein